MLLQNLNLPRNVILSEAKNLVLCSENSMALNQAKS